MQSKAPFSGDDAARYRQELAPWLTRVTGNEEEAANLLHHLGDIRSACEKTATLLADLPSLDVETSGGRQHLATLQGELFDHLAWHLKESRPILKALMKRVYRAAEARGELG
jgi:hypothetical protein